MVKGLYTAYTGMVNEQRRLDVLSNNLANSNTTGFKKEQLVPQSFKDELAIKIKDTSYAGGVPRGIGDIVFGVKVGEVFTDWSQGSFQITDKASDIAISGQGFFAIEYTNKGGQTSIMYSRDGAFTVDRDGYFRTSDGDYLLNSDGAMNSRQGQYVRINPNLNYSIDQLGNVYQNNQIVAQIGVVDVANYDSIEKYGENLYTLMDGGQIIASTATVEQGCLEASNINVVDEMVDMITIARAYEAGQKMIQTVDSTLEKAANQVGRV